jgi:chorismate synthase
MNTFGTKLRVTTYGESHGLAVGGIIDGCPSGIRLDLDAIKTDLARRRQGALRQEEDEIEWLSGLKDGVTLGTPIAFTIRNKNTRSEDYDQLVDCYRPGHADYTYQQKYSIRDHRGGGRASARETVVRVVAGAIAKQIIAPIEIQAFSEGERLKVKGETNEPLSDTFGGIVSCRITGLPAGVGEPIFDKLNAHLAFAMMSIPSAIGFEMGAGFKAAEMKGSEYIDRWNECLNATMFECVSKNATATQTITQTNHCGGVQGGISNGMPVEFRVAFHPVPTLPQPVECLTADGGLRTVQVPGRHDRSQVPRAAVVVEAMAAMVMADYLLDNR